MGSAEYGYLLSVSMGISTRGGKAKKDHAADYDWSKHSPESISEFENLTLAENQLASEHQLFISPAVSETCL